VISTITCWKLPSRKHLQSIYSDDHCGYSGNMGKVPPPIFKRWNSQK